MTHPNTPLLSLQFRLVLPMLCLAFGYGLGFIQPSGLALAVLLSALLFLGEKSLPTGVWWLLALLGCAALVFHLLPGFGSSTLWPARQLSDDAPPYSLRFGWDKLTAGIILLAWWLGQPRKTLSNPKQTALVAAATLIAVPLLALGTGLVGWQPKWPEGLALWLLVNLGVVSLAEELLFRGLLQTQLVRWLGAWAGIGISTAIFAAAHLPFSPLFALLAGVAGLGYGLVYHFSGRISLAIALHLAVNTLHILLLSYPLRLPVG
jgi:membrane protease YdiL (CAAX protease family)